MIALAEWVCVDVPLVYHWVLFRLHIRNHARFGKLIELFNVFLIVLKVTRRAHRDRLDLRHSLQEETLVPAQNVNQLTAASLFYETAQVCFGSAERVRVRLQSTLALAA